LSKERGGYWFVLTYICLASRWREAAPLKVITAKAVAKAMMEVMCRTNIPLTILTDQGSQFVGRLTRELCQLLLVEQLKTSAYHPQSNGCLECMHSTLETILAKCRAVGPDLVDQLPIALAALRQCPSKSTGYSPAEILWKKKRLGVL